MADLGYFSLLLSLFLAAYALLADLLGTWRGRGQLLSSAKNATIASLISLTAGTLALWVLLIKSDFSVTYVAEHTSRALPLAYKISALWAGAAGSLLLWLWLQVAFVVWVFCRRQRQADLSNAGPRMLANLVSVYFLFVLIFDKNPFATSSTPAADGAGLNPLLQHPAMALHPPTLFIGYAAFAVPFIWAIVAIIGDPGKWAAVFVDRIRTWVLLAWLFLTVGIGLGAWWAYEELGWGGYWAWDPVENSSLMPWLTATALLHCSRIYSSRSSIARWLIFLCMLTYSLCIFGTFLTRYGLVSSVHAFPEPGLGILFMVLLAHVWLIAAVLVAFRLGRIRDRQPSQAGKAHTYIAANNLLMLVLTLVIFIGTLFPFFSGLLSKQKITLKPEFFTKMTAPGGLVLLLFISFCPFLVRFGLGRNKRTIGAVVVSATAIAAWATLNWFPGLPARMGITVVNPASEALAVACLVLCGFGFANLAADIIVRLREGLAKIAWTANLRWFGARVVHLGVIMAFAGIAGSGGYDSEKQVALKPSEKLEIRGYEITYDSLAADHGANFTAVTANVTVRKGDRELAKLAPALAFYTASNKRTSEIDVRRTLAGDLYLALTEVDNMTRTINLMVLVKPLINWIWIGTIVSSFGTIMVLISLYAGRKGLRQE